MANVRVGILGATGYTALELLKILLRHPDVEVTALTSRQEDRPHVAMVHPQLAGRLDLCLENLPPESVAARTDVVFSCLPHAASAEAVKKYLAQDVRVVDFSADYRSRDQASPWFEKDAVKVLAERLDRDADNPRLQIEAEVEAEIREAFQFAEDSPFPSDEALYTHMFKEELDGAYLNLR
ncbi:hypothetical protein IH992_18150 [Candidatus Poribacteria bacterium]|nr:hypothetical protein [Candidatus Poribacteria bacterium]